MSNNKRNGSFLAGKGYYIALILCACAIGVTGYVYYRNESRSQSVSVEQAPAEAESSPDEELVPALATKPHESLPTAPTATAPDTQPTQPPSRTLKTVAPLAGQEVAPYSMEALSYNQTTRDWRVHDGVDIAAQEGTPVFAAADGTVEAVYEDDAMGYTVVISHQGGYTSSYSSLSKDTAVSKGDTVHMGQVIGCVGSTALLETTLGSHIHFSVTYQGNPMDPADFLAMGQ